VTTWVSFQEETPPQHQALSLYDPNIETGDRLSPQLRINQGSTFYAVDADVGDAVLNVKWEPAPLSKHAGFRHAGFWAYSPFVARITSELNAPRPRFLHFPITDYHAPSLSYLKEIATTVKEVLNKDEGAVYLHCWGGRGRSGTVGAAVLSLMYPDAPKEEIMNRLQEAFNTRGVEGETPETEEQRKVLSDFMNEQGNF